MIISIKDFLAKYAKLEPKEKHIKEAIISAVEKHTQQVILPSDIRIQNTTAFLHTHPLIKKEILSMAADIIEDIQKTLAKKIINTIQ